MKFIAPLLALLTVALATTPSPSPTTTDVASIKSDAAKAYTSDLAFTGSGKRDRVAAAGIGLAALGAGVAGFL